MCEPTDKGGGEMGRLMQCEGRVLPTKKGRGEIKLTKAV